MDPRRPPLVDPTPIVPREAVIETGDLPEYAKTAEEWWQIVDRVWPAILDVLDRVGMSQSKSGAETLRVSRDHALAAVLDEAWAAAPDAYFIHSWPQWGRICDLCSEQHVLFPEEER